MSISYPQLRQFVVRPALEQLGLYSLAADQLVMGTIAQESNGSYLKQIGKGPALGLIQMEPATHKDIWLNFLKYKPALRDHLLSMTSDTVDLVYDECGWPDHQALIWNLRYAIAMCRIYYYRKPQALPKASDIKALAQYWKDHYNTVHGAGTVSEFIHNFPFELYGLDQEQFK
ncbi:hypothetical protein [Marinomonas atlantica]|uniref:hypothetical protein n=1 Tax=Marinomonas atlantica TaxID=1806668 RepID=UPI00082BC23A|nr:hypothetical protein [Marinomonas atlantica]